MSILILEIGKVIKQEDLILNKVAPYIDRYLTESEFTTYDKNINESFFTKEDLEVNVEDFPTKNKILYITGLSGSGKSTLAGELSKKYNCANIELDLFWSAARWTKEEFIARLKNKAKFSTGDPEIDNIIISYLEKLPESDFKYRKSPNEQSQELLDHVIKVIRDFIVYFEKLNKVAILEGCWLVHIGPDFFEGKSLIIKGTGIAKANARAVKRYWKKDHDLKSDIRILFQRIKLTIFPNKYFRKLYNDFDNFFRYQLSESEFSDDLKAIYGDLPPIDSNAKEYLSEGLSTTLVEKDGKNIFNIGLSRLMKYTDNEIKADIKEKENGKEVSDYKINPGDNGLTLNYMLSVIKRYGGAKEKDFIDLKLDQLFSLQDKAKSGKEIKVSFALINSIYRKYLKYKGGI